MKKNLLGLSIFLLAGIMASCSGSGSKIEKEMNNSAPQVEEVPIVSDSTATTPDAQASTDSVAPPQEQKAENLSITDFCKWDASEKVMAMKDDKKIIAQLEKLGFTCEKTSTVKVEYCGADVKEKHYDYVREVNGQKISVELEGLEIEIDFPNKEMVDEFINTALSNRFKKAPKDYNHFTYVGPNLDCYWTGTDIKVSGNTVKLISRFEC